MKLRFRFLPVFTVIIFLLLILVTAALVRTQTVYAAKTDKYENLDLFTQAMYLIENNYVEPVDNKKLVYGAIKGMTEELDPFSTFFDPKELAAFEEETQGEFGGLGITIGMKDHTLTVIAPLEDTPAFKKGIKAGDMIIKINGESTQKFSIDDAVNKLRGKEGTDVTITVLRKNVAKPFDVTMKRAIIKIKSVKYTMIDNNIGYIRMAQFTNDVSGEMTKALKSLEKQGAQSFIVDLRNNPGGLLNEAQNVSSLFLPSNRVVVYTLDRNKTRQDYKSVSTSEQELTKPLVVLVNEGSASAAEIFTGAMQDYGRAVIVGTKTYGKASVQNVMHLPDGSGIKLTIAKYYTPNGRMIHGVGIEPDEKVELPKDDKDPHAEITAEEADPNLTANTAKAVVDLKKDVQLSSAVTKIKEMVKDAAKQPADAAKQTK